MACAQERTRAPPAPTRHARIRFRTNRWRDRARMRAPRPLHRWSSPARKSGTGCAARIEATSLRQHSASGDAAPVRVHTGVRIPWPRRPCARPRALASRAVPADQERARLACLSSLRWLKSSMLLKSSRILSTWNDSRSCGRGRGRARASARAEPRARAAECSGGRRACNVAACERRAHLWQQIEWLNQRG